MRKSNGKTGGAHLPSPDQLEIELQREEYRSRYVQALRGTVSILVVTAAVVVLFAFLLFPVFRIYGSSMSPTVNEGELVISLKGSAFECGDIVVLSFNNKLLVKRVIAGPGQWVNLDTDGNVSVDGNRIDEPYLRDKAYGDCTVVFPYQVPEGRFFVMGDNRSTSQDSRNALFGCIEKEQIIGRTVLRIWPLDSFGVIRRS